MESQEAEESQGLQSKPTWPPEKPLSFHITARYGSMNTMAALYLSVRGGSWGEDGNRPGAASARWRRDKQLYAFHPLITGVFSQ